VSVFRRQFVIAAALVLLPAISSGQTGSGTIAGTVRDASGGAIPGATVRIVNSTTRRAVEAVSGFGTIIFGLASVSLLADASERDNRTLELLYELPPGSVRDSEHVAQKDSLTPSP